MIFWDSSALVRCYAPAEEEHPRAKNLLVTQKGHQASVLIRPEAVSAVVRRMGRDRRLAGTILDLLGEHLRLFSFLALDDSQIELAVRLIRKHTLRCADAIHLAAALALAREIGKTSIRFATADGPQARAAREEGLRVIDLSSSR